MFADAEQLAVLPAFCPLVDYKQITEAGLLNFPLVFQCFQKTSKFIFWNTGLKMLIFSQTLART